MKRVLKNINLLWISCLLSCFLQAQSLNVDSLKKAAVTEKADTNRIKALQMLSSGLRFSYPDSAFMWGSQALVLSERLKNDTLIFWSYVNMASSLYPLGNFSAELDIAYKLQQIAKRVNTLYTRGYSNGVMSDAFLNFGEYKISLQYWRRVVIICEQEAPWELASIYGTTAFIHARAKQYDSSLFYSRKAYKEYYKQVDLRDSQLVHFYNSNMSGTMGEAFAGKQQWDSALFHYHNSLYHAELMDMRFNKVDACNGIAEIYKKQGYPDSAIYYCKRVLKLDGAPKRYPISVLKTATLLAALYEGAKQPDSSLKYMHLASDIKDSVYSRDKTSAFQSILFRERNKEKDIAIATEKLGNRYRMYFLIAFFIVLVIIATIVIRNRRIKQLQDIRNRIADDLHDDIGSTLSSISIMNELAKAKSPEALPLLTSIGENTAAIQENMSDIVWTVNPNNDHFENLLQRMNLFATEITDAKNIRLEFNSAASLNSIKLTMRQRKNVYLFFKEAINNAAKHSGAKKITVTVAKKENTIELHISDDGNGFYTEENFNGNGMNSLKRRAEDLNAIFHIHSELNTGTQVQLKFKIT